MERMQKGQMAFLARVGVGFCGPQLLRHHFQSRVEKLLRPLLCFGNWDSLRTQ